ncbi:MAG: hypothetical protein J5895_02750 [Alphaproteobacteria bacterium]|nr:hypothetical protein [Alphaproteobacteria bacterium]
MLFVFAFPAAVITALLYLAASLVAAMESWIDVLKILLWIFCALSAPLVLMVVYVIIASWFINRI